MAISPRPGTWVLEKSLDGKEYMPWQYFAISDAECMRQFGVPATVGVPRFKRDDEVRAFEWRERKKENLLFGILLNVPNSRWFVVLTSRSFYQSRMEKSMFLSSTTVQESTIPQSYPRSCSDSLALAMSDSVLFRPGLWMLIWWSSTGNRIESTRVSPHGILVTNFPRGNISFQIFLRHFGHFHRRSMYLSWTCRELSFGSDHWGSSKFVRTFIKIPNSAIQMRLQAQYVRRDLRSVLPSVQSASLEARHQPWREHLST